MKDVPFDYRIKKLIHRAHPMEFIELVDGRYYWSCDGELKQLAELMKLTTQSGHAPRLAAVIDKGIACLHQIEGYLTWLGNEGLDEFMHSGRAPFPTIPDWLIWHELKRLHSYKGDREVAIYIKQHIDNLYLVAKTHKAHPEGWLIYSGAVADYVLTTNCIALKLERGGDVVTHVNFGNARGVVTASVRGQDAVPS